MQHSQWCADRLQAARDLDYPYRSYP